MSRKLLGASGLLIAAVLLLGINIISNATLRGARLDLTENKLFTLSSGSRAIVANLDEPIRLRLFFSERKTANIPFLRAYAQRVREFLEEYAAASGGNIILEVIDPEPFSEAEDLAVAAGIQGIPVTRSDRIYFGLQGLSTTDMEEVIPYFDQDRENFLEYDITSLIHKLSYPDRRVLSVISGVPIQGDEVDAMAQMMGQRPEREPWAIYRNMQELYDVRTLSRTVTEIPEETDVLMLVHPRDLSEETQYAIDQFVLGGGRALVFVDPHAEVYEPPADPSNPMAAATADRSSRLSRLLRSWGLEMVEDRIVADRRLAQTVNAGSRTSPEMVRYVLWMGLGEESLNKDEYTVARLQTINVASAGALRPRDDAETEFIPLLRSSEDSMLLPVERVRFFPQPRELLADFAADDERHVLAARISGPARTAFPDGPANGELRPGHLEESNGDINVIVMADVDVLNDMMWIQAQNFLGQRMFFPVASNGDLAINFLDHLSGSQDLISIRGRAGFNRPFTAVEKLEEQAVERFAATQRELEEKLAETERRINELQRGRADADNTMILTPEQREEIERFQEERLRVSQELRRVNLALRHDIEKLGTRLKFINIGLMPILVGVLAIGLGVVRTQRRKKLRK